MTEFSKPASDRSVHFGGEASENVIQTGDRNIASVQYQHVTLPPPESVDMVAEIAALRRVLSRLDSSNSRKIDNALGDAEDELVKSEPDKAEVGKALDRALDYAKTADGFLKAVETLKPHITNAAAWLGGNWYKILAVVGLAA